VYTLLYRLESAAQLVAVHPPLGCHRGQTIDGKRIHQLKLHYVNYLLHMLSFLPSAKAVINRGEGALTVAVGNRT
jgi:hypothetical protein